MFACKQALDPQLSLSLSLLKKKANITSNFNHDIEFISECQQQRFLCRSNRSLSPSLPPSVTAGLCPPGICTQT